jgi:hypothetical protein
MENILNCLKVEASILNYEIQEYKTIKDSLENGMKKLKELNVSLETIKIHCDDVLVSPIAEIVEKEEQQIKTISDDFAKKTAGLEDKKNISLKLLKLCHAIYTNISEVGVFNEQVELDSFVIEMAKSL